MNEKICQRELSLCGPLRVARQPRPAALVDPFSVATIRGVKGVIFFNHYLYYHCCGECCAVGDLLLFLSLQLLWNLDSLLLFFVTAVIVINITINIIVIMMPVYCH